MLPCTKTIILYETHTLKLQQISSFILMTLNYELTWCIAFKNAFPQLTDAFLAQEQQESS